MQARRQTGGTTNKGDCNGFWLWKPSTPRTPLAACTSLAPAWCACPFPRGQMLGPACLPARPCWFRPLKTAKTLALRRIRALLSSVNRFESFTTIWLCLLLLTKRVITVKLSNKGVVSAAVCHEKVKLEKNWSMDLWCVLHRYLPRAELILKFD